MIYEKDPSKQLFDRFTEEYIRECLIRKQSEDEFLECKTVSSDWRSDKPVLGKDEKTNFAKALSGFANTNGGVLVFGLATKRTGPIDFIDSVQPIDRLESFQSFLSQEALNLVERPVLGVEYKSICWNNAVDSGVLVIWIPKSQHRPHRVKHKGSDKSFYGRFSGSFLPLDLEMVEALMLYRGRPECKLSIEEETNGYFYNLCLENIGDIVAKHLAVVLEFPEDLPIPYDVAVGKDPFWQKISVYRGKRGKFLLYGGQAVHSLVPGIPRPILTYIEVPHNQGNQQYEINSFIVAEGMAIKEEILTLQTRPRP